MSTKHMSHVGIFGLDGVIWASSPAYPLTTEHIKQIISAMSAAGGLSNGLVINNEKYILVRGEPTMLVLKKGQSGLVAFKSAQCVIVALHDPNVKAETTLTAVGKVIDYLCKHGY